MDEIQNGGSTGAPAPEPSGGDVLYDVGPEIDSMTESEAAKLWRETTLDDSQFSYMPRSKFLEMRDKLFKKGFEPKIAKQNEAQEEKDNAWLERENRRIEDRDDLEREKKAKEIGIKFFGSEKELDRVIEEAVETVKGLSKENRDFLNTETPNSQFTYGDLPSIISLLAGIRGDRDLINTVNQIGLGKLINLANKSGIFRRRR